MDKMKKYLLLLAIVNLLWAGHPFSNALLNEKSPYLQQHAHNPVNWYPWGDEAFEKAKREKKLIFLSIGYSTCHWCHVMEEESFRDREVASLLNANYISIKVDKEQYPQIDRRYQRLFRLHTGRRGGWPLSVFMTPDKKVFFITTYIPKEAGYGSDGLLQLLPHYSGLYVQDPKKIEKQTEGYGEIAKEALSPGGRQLRLDSVFIGHIIDQIAAEYDPLNGGFSKRPKFPEASKISLLLDIYKINSSGKALEMAEKTLEKMAKSGLYDQVEGGFFRYTPDAQWHIPHFEKMLYTNAELIVQYVRLYQIDPKPLYLKVVRETIAEMDRHFMEGGLYFGSSDADSGGEEGGYYLYCYDDAEKGLKAAGLNSTEISGVLSYLGIDEDGNVDGEYSHLRLTGEKAPAKLEEAKSYLRKLRSAREFPFVDRKIISSWNAMMIKSLFAAGRIDKHFTEEGESRLKSLLDLMSKGERLYHQTLFGSHPRQDGILEDYAFMVDALIEAQQVTHEARYLKLAENFAREAVRLFYRDGKWYLSADGTKVLADADDRHYTSSLSVMLSGLVSLAVLTENPGFSNSVGQTLKQYDTILKKTPASSPGLVSVFLRQKIGDVVIKSSYSNLMRNRVKIASINYPFVLTEAVNTSDYLACKPGVCFAESKKLDKLAKRIEQERGEIGLVKSKRWK